MIIKTNILNLIVRILPPLLFFSLAALLLLGSSMNANLIRDEHQFVASAKIFLDDNLTPYVDYPYFHMPYLVFIYAFIYKFCGFVLLAARLVSVFSGFLILLLVFFIAIKLFNNFAYIHRCLIAIGFSSILLNNPLFVYASNYAWNHNLSVLFSLLTFILISHSSFRASPKKYLFFAGIFLGLSIGIRLSFLPTVVPFLIMIFFSPNACIFKEKIRLIFSFCLGVFVALLPAILMFTIAPVNFVFGNFEYAKFNTLYRQQMDYKVAMTLFGKFSYLKNAIISNPCNLLFLFAFLVFVMTNINRRNLQLNRLSEIIFLLVLLPFLLLGSFAPTPSWYQYYYAPVPFALVGIVYGMKKILDNDSKNRVVIIFFLLLIFFSYAYGPFGPERIKHYLYKAFSPFSWEPLKIHRLGRELGTFIKHGKVLTFAPIFPLEGEVRIYKEFATGPFAYRVGHLISENKKRQYRIVSQNELIGFLNQNTPEAIFTGFESDLENIMDSYAKDNRYKRVQLSNKKTLWLLSSTP